MSYINLCSNSDFETDMWPLTFFNPPATSLDTTIFKYSTKSMKCVFSGANTGGSRAINITGLVPGNYIFSGWIYIENFVGGICFMQLFESGVINATGANLIANQGWTRYTKTFTYPSGGSGIAALRFGGGLNFPNNPNFTAYLDGVIVETGSIASDYIPDIASSNSFTKKIVAIIGQH